jgi:hypothetical protein
LPDGRPPTLAAWQKGQVSISLRPALSCRQRGLAGRPSRVRFAAPVGHALDGIHRLSKQRKLFVLNTEQFDCFYIY